MNDLELMLEVFEWRDVKGYEGLYKVSEYGDVLSIKSNALLKPQNDGRGYLNIGLYKNGKRKYHKIHRLVATAFCEGAEYFNEVNHIDEDKANNHYSNLEWCTREYNTKYSSHKKEKRVKCVELNKTFESITKAEKIMGCGNISECLAGRQKTAAGFHWEYVK